MQELQLSLFEKNEAVAPQEEFSQMREQLINPIKNNKTLTTLAFYTPELIVGEETLQSIKVSTKAKLYTEIAFEETGYYPSQDSSDPNMAGYLITRDIKGVHVTTIYKSINHYYTLPFDEFKEAVIPHSTTDLPLETISIKKFIEIVKNTIK